MVYYCEPPATQDLGSSGYYNQALYGPEGPRAKATGGEAIVYYCEPPATQDLGSSGPYNSGFILEVL